MSTLYYSDDNSVYCELGKIEDFTLTVGPTSTDIPTFDPPLTSFTTTFTFTSNGNEFEEIMDNILNPGEVCKNCGAAVRGQYCEYCGTSYRRPTKLGLYINEKEVE